jgi:uncharacterized protein YwqG
MEQKLELSDNLEKYRENIEATIKPYIEITAQKNSNIPLWQSKFGGGPYFPKEMDYPTDSQGKPMYLLAQINFAETPMLEGFPEKGILQFYISGNSDVYGLCFDDQCKQEDYRVIYFQDVLEDESLLVTKFDFLPESDYLPFNFQSALVFKLCFEPITICDYQFEPKILNLEHKMGFDLYDCYQDIYDEYGENFYSIGHKIGGYPYFTQYDPRGSKKYQGEQTILLFQMDTDDDAGIMWGDAGVANFFIPEEDLKNLDFSNVLYNWDCC